MPQHFNPICGRVCARQLRGYLAVFAVLLLIAVAWCALCDRETASAASQPSLVKLTIHDLPGSDCTALASSGVWSKIAGATLTTFSINGTAYTVT
jgi:hypothetical protein